MVKANPLLSGIRVLDLTRLLPGPFCTLYLAQMGAEVIKVEDPRGGDYCRTLSPELFALVNRGKKSITLDLKDPNDRSSFMRLVQTADMVIESFRPGVMDRLECGYKALRAVNPRLVYAALTGYGQTGPYSDRAGHDVNYRAYAGELERAAEAGIPIEMDGVPIADLAGGALTCAVGMLAALIGARESGQGTFLDVAMVDGVLALQIQQLATVRARLSGNSQGALTGEQPNYGIYRCADGKYVALGAVEDKFFSNLCALAHREDLLELPSGSGSPGRPLRAALCDLFLTKSRNEWEAILGGRDTCLSAVLSLDEAIAGPQNAWRKTVDVVDGLPVLNLPFRFSAATPTVLHSPALGGANEEILSSCVASE